ncbi:proline dehydrogenase family protein [Solitalea sp. MAHUQ-68]|uniref:Proline dehydrogenase family protein n=1 Tax=Solitalea agri TaxID=2953739 RepID=A0A9X2JBU1_9SPHI|nr:proline dehydrogenase family protein [Solitalea agri]MCO4292343.1 proline dehydrogenase family protein [Solitalea agri]
MIESPTINKPSALSFDNTEIAFSHMSDSELKRAYWLFKVINVNFLVKIGPPLTNFAMKIGLPIEGIIRKTIFSHFCGGESIRDCESTINQLANFKVGTILDYSVEGENNEKAFDETCHEIISTISRATKDHKVPFSVFKVTGLGRFELLEKIHRGDQLTPKESDEWLRVQSRVDMICHAAYQAGIPVMVDAEETWIQDPIDNVTIDMMKKYNRIDPIVYNTYQIYRHDRLAFLKKNTQDAEEGNYYLGAKLVRGAYMEKERERAAEMGYKSPIQPNKEATDRDYDEAVKFCIEHFHRISFVAGTHNEVSCMKLVNLLAEHNIDTKNPKVYFSQLLGMSDNLSYNLSHENYNVVKYVPYGPVKSVLPYLFRRAQENTAIAGQMGRELGLIVKEKKRRGI